MFSPHHVNTLPFTLHCSFIRIIESVLLWFWIYDLNHAYVQRTNEFWIRLILIFFSFSSPILWHIFRAWIFFSWMKTDFCCCCYCLIWCSLVNTVKGFTKWWNTNRIIYHKNKQQNERMLQKVYCVHRYGYGAFEMGAFVVVAAAVTIEPFVGWQRKEGKIERFESMFSTFVITMPYQRVYSIL